MTDKVPSALYNLLLEIKVKQNILELRKEEARQICRAWLRNNMITFHNTIWKVDVVSETGEIKRKSLHYKND